jgi:hypothetical protein
MNRLGSLQETIVKAEKPTRTYPRGWIRRLVAVTPELRQPRVAYAASSLSVIILMHMFDAPFHKPP